MIRSLIASALFIFSVSNLTAQNGYSNYLQQVSRLQQLNKQYPQLSSLQSIGKTVSGKDIWMLTIGSGKMETKPAIAIVGGVEGNHLLGTELARFC
jgi:hypothetical protein